MFYNSHLMQKSIQKGNISENCSQEKSPRQLSKEDHKKLIDLRNKQNISDLLIVKYLRKNGINKPQILLKEEIEKYSQGGKLSKKDLNILNSKIKQILENHPKTRNKIFRSLKAINLNEKNKNLLSEGSIEKLPNIIHTLGSRDNLNNNIKSISDLNTKEFINPLKNNSINNTIENLVTTPSAINKTNINNNNIKNDYSSFSSENIFNRKKISKKIAFLKPEEELAQLESEFSELRKQQKPIYKTIDFTEGNEWAAISNYNRKLYEEQLKEEKRKERNTKLLTKLYLDEQIKSKILKEYEEQKKEQEYKKNFIEYQKNLELIEKQQKEEIHKRFLSQNQIREKQIEEKRIQKRIDELKEKKFDNEFIANIKKSLEKDKQIQINKKKVNDEIYKQIYLMSESKRKLKMDQIEFDKKENIRYLQESEQMEQKRETRRKQIMNKGKSLDFNENAKKILAKIRDEIKDEDEKYKKMNLDQKKIYDAKIEKEKKKKANDKIELKKYLELQIEEKKKDEAFKKIIDQEQRRILDTDSKKYKEDQKINELKIKKRNNKINNILMKQIIDKREKDLKKNSMTLAEYSLNKKLLEKIKEKQAMYNKEKKEDKI